MFFYGNITRWNKRIESFVGADKADVLCLVEHHLDKSQYLAVSRRIAAFKRTSFVSFAERLGDHVLSTSGGQVILPRTHLFCEAVDQDLLDLCIPEDHRQSPRWTACILRTKSVSILIITLYLRTGEGFSEANASILQQIFTLVGIFRGAVIIGGDWQFPPQELVVSPWLQRLGLTVVVPTGVEVTCTAGSGRLIDYFVTSKVLAPYISVSPEFDVPFMAFDFPAPCVFALSTYLLLEFLDLSRPSPSLKVSIPLMNVSGVRQGLLHRATLRVVAPSRGSWDVIRSCLGV